MTGITRRIKENGPFFLAGSAISICLVLVIVPAAEKVGAIVKDAVPPQVLQQVNFEHAGLIPLALLGGVSGIRSKERFRQIQKNRHRQVAD